MRFAADENHYTELWYDPEKSVITIDRSHSGLDESIPARRTIKVSDRRGRLSLRIILDKWSAEIFINDGEQTMSLTFYTDLSAEEIRFRAEGEALMDMTAYTLAESE